MKIIYFLVNNHYQLIDVKKHLSHFKKKKYKIVILVCSRTNLEIELKNLKGFQIINLYSPQIRFRFTWYLNFIKVYKFLKEIRSKLIVNKNTYLFFYTEIDILNHLIVKFIKYNGGTNYIINDAGFATYLNFSNFTEIIYAKSFIIRKYILKLIPFLRNTRLVKGYHYHFFWLQDHYIDGVIGYKYFSNKRDFPLYLLNETKKTLKISPNNKVLFLNSMHYSEVLESDLDTFLKMHQLIFKKLLKSYSEIIFKFHPRDSEVFRNEIRKKYQNEKRIKLLDSIDDYQNLIIKLKIKCIASICSSGCLSAPKGIKVIFCFNLVKKFFPLEWQSSFKEIDKLLKLWGGKKEKGSIVFPATFNFKKKHNYLSSLLPLVEIKKCKLKNHYAVT